VVMIIRGLMRMLVEPVVTGCEGRAGVWRRGWDSNPR
jgi:hypothetical protein